MKNLSEEIRYGFELYPLTALIIVGMFISTTVPTLFQSVMSGMSSIPMYRVVLFVGILLIQLIGGVTAAAGFFGALYKVVQEAKE